MEDGEVTKSLKNDTNNASFRLSGVFIPGLSHGYETPMHHKH
jgi:hypothetical protein